MARLEPLSEEMRRSFYRRTPRGTYKLNADQKAQISQRLRAFHKIKKPSELQKKEIYRMEAALRGRVKPLRRDVGGADVGLFGGKPGPHQILYGMGAAGAGAGAAVPRLIPFVSSAGQRLGLKKAAQAAAGLGYAVLSKLQPSGARETPKTPPLGSRNLDEIAQEVRRMRRRAGGGK